DARQADQWTKQIDDLLDRDDLGEALRLAEKLHQLRRDKQGAKHWQTWDAGFQVMEVKRLQQRPAGERQSLRQAIRLTVTGIQHYHNGREAEKVFRQALVIWRQALPAGHPHLATSLNNLGESLRAQGKPAEAEKLHREALAIRQKALP